MTSFSLIPVYRNILPTGAVVIIYMVVGFTTTCAVSAYHH